MQGIVQFGLLGLTVLSIKGISQVKDSCHSVNANIYTWKQRGENIPHFVSCSPTETIAKEHPSSSH